MLVQTRLADYSGIMPPAVIAAEHFNGHGTGMAMPL